MTRNRQSAKQAGDINDTHLGNQFRHQAAPYGDPNEATGELIWYRHDKDGTVTIELEGDDSLHELNLHPNDTLEAL